MGIWFLKAKGMDHEPRIINLESLVLEIVEYMSTKKRRLPRNHILVYTYHKRLCTKHSEERIIFIYLLVCLNKVDAVFNIISVISHDWSI